MYPSDTAERRIKRIGVILIIVMALIFLIWMIGLIARALRGTLEQREFPEEAATLRGDREKAVSYTLSLAPGEEWGRRRRKT